MKRSILVSLMIIGMVSAGLGATTMAIFNDTETSTDNQFTAGELDLKVDWNESYNGEHVETQELTNNPGRIFNLQDIKPGDHGEATVSLHLDDNPGWIWMNLNQTSNWDNACTEPERKAEGQCGSYGELGEHLEFTIWADDGDNIRQDDEKVIFQGTAHELEEESLEEGILLDGNPSTNETEAFPGGETSYVGIKWEVPLETGNEIQGDSKTFDISFYTEQRRHNDDPDNPFDDQPEDPGNETPEDPGNETPEDPGNETPVDDNETEDVYYQVDLVGGEPITDLSESTYHSEGRMQRYMHGGPDNPIDNESEPDQVKTGTGGPDCVDSEPFEVNSDENTVSVDFEINNITPECGTDTELSLVSYQKSYPGWVAERADEQEIFDSHTERFEPGNYSMTISIPETNESAAEDPDDQPSEEPEFVATQGNTSVELSPIEGSETVEEFYDFRLPDRFDNEANRNASNGASYGSGPYYGSAGTEDIQQGDTSLMFLYDGPDGLSFVVVHEGEGSNDGGSATFEITNLDGEGEWVVKDDYYLNDDGSIASSNYDRWNTSSNPQTIDWTWGSGGSDGGAYQPLGDDFEFTIDPAFNNNSELYEQFYNGDVDEWQVISGERNNPERTELEMDEEVTVSAE